MTNKKYNEIMEKKALVGDAKTRRRKYREIVRELGIRHITLSDINNNTKPQGFAEMLTDTSMTMDDMVILQQYSKAIIDRDTKSAEFLRDTAGEKPSTQIDMSVEEKGLSKMSLDELRELKEAIILAKEMREIDEC